LLDERAEDQFVLSLNGVHVVQERGVEVFKFLGRYRTSGGVLRVEGEQVTRDLVVIPDVDDTMPRVGGCDHQFNPGTPGRLRCVAAGSAPASANGDAGIAGGGGGPPHPTVVSQTAATRQ